MKIKQIPYQSGFVFVDEITEIKEGDRYMNGPYLYTADRFFERESNDKKVIAQHNLNLEGIPYVELEEDVEKLCPYEKGGLLDWRNRWIEGYQANKKEFTREQMDKAIKMAKQIDSVSMAFDYSEDEIIQSLQPKIESIEPEMHEQEVPTGGSGSTSYPIFEKVLITYQRDGKTYIKAKVNYEKS